MQYIAYKTCIARHCIFSLSKMLLPKRSHILEKENIFLEENIFLGEITFSWEKSHFGEREYILDEVMFCLFMKLYNGFINMGTLLWTFQKTNLSLPPKNNLLQMKQFPFLTVWKTARKALILYMTWKNSYLMMV